MKSPVICKSECNTWYVLAYRLYPDGTTEYGVIFEGKRKKDCISFLGEAASCL